MKLEVTIEELRKRKLFIATPMYGGVCHGLYTQSMLNAQKFFARHGIEFKYFAIFNESLITRARNYCVAEFLRTDCTHLLFIDSDIEFQPQYVLDALAIADPESDKDVICGPYPKKQICWEKVVDAVNQGFADENPNVLESFAADFVINFTKAGSIKLDEPVEVGESGTGFMLIQRGVFEKFAAAKPETLYKPDHVRNEGFDGSQMINAFFMDPIDPESRRQLSEDYYFCQEVRKLGMKVWLCPWFNLNHLGYQKFVGNMSALAAINASPTADENKFKRQ